MKFTIQKSIHPIVSMVFANTIFVYDFNNTNKSWELKKSNNIPIRVPGDQVERFNDLPSAQARLNVIKNFPIYADYILRIVQTNN